jgi:hypothetical protein
MNLGSVRKTVVVVTGDPMTEKDIASALASITPRSLDALVQLIDKYRQDAALTAAGYAATNNSLAMATESGKYEALTGLVSEINDRRGSAD